MALRLALTVGLVGAQLLPEPPVDFHELQRLMEEEGLLTTEDVANTNLSSPTICDSSVKQHSGYLDVAIGTKYFFWMFESRSKPSTDPLVLWLTGGPGCSSQLALLAENGPCNMAKNGTGTEKNPYSWTSNANVIWVDQPAATGFSTGLPLVHDEDGVAGNMYNFMQEGFAGVDGLRKRSNHLTTDWMALPQCCKIDFDSDKKQYSVSNFPWKVSEITAVQ